MAKESQKNKPSNSIDMRAITSSLKDLWSKIEYHVGFGYAVILLSGVICAVYLVGQTLRSDSASTDSATDPKYSTKFDTATIDKVNQLDGTTNSNNVNIPGGHINPFTE